MKLVYNKLKLMLLPHIEDSDIRKGYFIGYMVNKLLNTYLGRLPYDNRDSFLNKKIESSGELLGQLFRTNFAKFTKDMKSSIDKDIRQGRIDECGLNLSKKFKPNDISGGMKYALGTGNWGSKSQAKNKKGIAQLLPRLSYLGTLSSIKKNYSTY